MGLLLLFSAGSATGSANLSAASTLAATGSATASGSASLSAVASLSGAGVALASGSASLLATATLGASGAASATGGASLASVSTLSAMLNPAGGAMLFASATLTATGTARATGGAGLVASATLTATGQATASGSANLASSATLAADGLATASGEGSLLAVSALSADGVALASGSADLAAEATLGATLEGRISGSADLLASATLTASIGPSSGALLVAVSTLTATGATTTVGLDIRQVLYARLLADPALHAVIGTKIKAGQLPAGIVTPALSFFVVEQDKGFHLTGPDHTRVAQVQIDAWAKSNLAGAVATKVAADGLMLGWVDRQGSSGVEVIWVLPDGEHDLHKALEDGSGDIMFHIALRYLVKYRLLTA